MDQNIRLSVIVPTQGRPTLLEALESLGRAGLQPQDEVIVVVDGTDPVPDVARMVDLAGLVATTLVSSVPEARDYGNTPRNHGLGLATGTHIVYLDDDDLAEPDSYPALRSLVAASPDRPHMFQFEAQWGEVLPRGPFLVKSRCGGHGFVPPNDPAMLAPWGRTYEGDWEHIKGTVDAYGGEDAVVFHEQVVARCRRS